jgi:SAM-dependent methyltransferase
MHNITTVEIWDREYRQLHSIPSSTRQSPSKALLIVEPLIDFVGVHRVFDAGCGNGRNAIHLATLGCNVVAVDLSPAALDAARVFAFEAGMLDRINFAIADLFKPLPYENNQFDLCLDSYVSCHFTDPSWFESYWRELTRITRPGGLIFSSMFSIDDEYYAELIGRDSSHSIVTDPINGITKVIYREDQFKLLFNPPLILADFLKFQFMDRVIDRDYRRSLLIALLKNMG